MSELFAVIDTERTWSDRVMSIGVVISNCDNYEVMDRIYYVFTIYISSSFYSNRNFKIRISISIVHMFLSSTNGINLILSAFSG